MNRIGDEPIEARASEIMRALAAVVEQALNQEVGKPKQWGFCLMVFPFAGFEGRANYISNARRDDIVRLLRTQLDRFEELQ